MEKSLGLRALIANSESIECETDAVFFNGRSLAKSWRPRRSQGANGCGNCSDRPTHGLSHDDTHLPHLAEIVKQAKAARA